MPIKYPKIPHVFIKDASKIQATEQIVKNIAYEEYLNIR